MGPAGLPSPVVARLQSEIAKALADPEVSGKLDEVGIVPIGNPTAEFAATLRRQTDELATLAKQIGIEPN
jgi:tripartite-type tricarboxylate transporter receptor subunit TctC